MPSTPHKIPRLDVSIDGMQVGHLQKASTFEFHYASNHASLERIAQAMQEVLTESKGDTRVPTSLRSLMEHAWQTGLQYASMAPISDTALRATHVDASVDRRPI